MCHHRSLAIPSPPPIHPCIPAISLYYIPPHYLSSTPLVNSPGATIPNLCLMFSLSCPVASLVTCNPPPYQHHCALQRSTTIQDVIRPLQVTRKKNVFWQWFEPAQLILALIHIFNQSGLLDCQSKEGQAAPGRTPPEHTWLFTCLLIIPTSWKGKNKQIVSLTVHSRLMVLQEPAPGSLDPSMDSHNTTISDWTMGGTSALVLPFPKNPQRRELI